MASQRPTGSGSRQPYYEPPSVETEEESEDESDVSDDEGSDEDDDEFPATQHTPANMGSKRSDPSIAQKKNKYATSDSGYSSLTATTASSSQSKKAAEQPSTTEKLKQKLAQTLRMPTKTPAPAQRPMTPRRASQRHERKIGHALRSVESREEAARLSLYGASSTRGNVASRRPSEPAPRTMPGDYPPSPKLEPAVPRAIPAARPRSNTTRTSGARPVSYHAGSAPVVYQMVSGQAGSQPSAQHFVINPAQPQHQQYPYIQPHMSLQQGQSPMSAQPLTVNTAGYNPAPHYQGYSNSPAAYVGTPTSNYHYPGGFAYQYPGHGQQHIHQAPLQYQQSALPQPQPQGQWQPGHADYNGALGEYYDHHSRRMSLTNHGHGYPYGQSPFYQDAPPHAAHIQSLRRMSQTVQNPGSMYRPPPPQTPMDEGVFFDDDDPEDYYRAFDGMMDREMMPPPSGLPIRPASSHRARPPMPHVRTASAVFNPHRLSRDSLEYVPELSPHKKSFERPPSRPGMQRTHSTSIATAQQRQLMYAQQQREPPSPVHRRRRPGSIYGQHEVEPTVQAAEAYQRERTGGYGPSVGEDDMPPITRRTTRTSDTGSKGSRGSGGRESGEKTMKRSNRQSLDKSKLREAHDTGGGVSLSIGTVRMNLKEGTSMTIKQSSEGTKSGALVPTAADGPSRPTSTKPTRDASRARVERPEVKRYISATNSARSSNKDRGEIEVPRRRRSSSVQPRIGRDDGVRELDDHFRKLRVETTTRQSRTSSRSGRAER